MVSHRHQKKDVAQALGRSEKTGLDVHEVYRGHRWGEVRCVPCGESRDVWSTPRNPATHAKQIDRFTNSHAHCAGG